jgi:hypothetical protein
MRTDLQINDLIIQSNLIDEFNDYLRVNDFIINIISNSGSRFFKINNIIKVYNKYL